jgi:thiol-disulfide isomerase/thioredoxin
MTSPSSPGIASALARTCAVGLAAAACAAVLACARPHSPPARPGGSAAANASSARVGPEPSEALVPSGRAQTIAPERVWAVLINGGGSPASNYLSHLIHVRAMLDWLDAAGVPETHIAVFSSDGDDPAADLAVRELRPGSDAQLLDGTDLEGRLGRPVEYVSTQIDGVKLRPATPEQLAQWFDGEGRALRAGDTLLLYVTDHGTRGKPGPEDTRISLWNRESITVRELDALVAKLDPGVRVVALMSQCFSGGFARLGQISPAGGPTLPGGRVCGFFSSTEDRPAYGCYPENRGKNNVGHSVRFLEALAETGDFSASHEAVLVRDRTPDVPLRSSDVQLELLVESAAKSRGVAPEAYADELLAEAWRDRAAWEHEIRLLDRIGRSFGLASPRSLAEVDERIAELPQAAEPLKSYASAWHESLTDLSRANLDRFLAAEPEWRQRTAPAATKDLGAPERRDLGGALIAELGPFTRADQTTDRRLAVLRERSAAAGGASYRMEVRAAALLRMRAVLLGIAGRVHLATRTTPEERDALDALVACEEVAISPGAIASSSPLLELAPEPDLPPYAEDVRIARESAPAWMGISFRPVANEKNPPSGLPTGAVRVREVMPQSPAERAGLDVGDVILGPPGRSFEEPRQVREWTMLRAVGEPAPLEVLRGREVSVRTLVPDTHPGRFPDLPGPPEVGSAAPALELEPYRGSAPGALASAEKPHLLFFWATWCLPCKASLPEVAAFARERGVEVVAITDEDRATLDEFFTRFHADFPATVARDTRRRTFRGYGVSGTPTFVLVDARGVVESYSSGYGPTKGLGVPGWRWAGASAAPVQPPAGTP